MSSKPTPEFRAEAVRIALTSGLPRKQMAADFGIGFSTLSRWIQQDRRNPEKPTVQSDLEREVAELRKESREHRHVIPVNRLCEIMDVGPRGYRAWCSPPACRRQRSDMVWLAHIREQFRLSLGSYGRPRMTEELKELGFDVGHCVAATTQGLHPP